MPSFSVTIEIKRKKPMSGEKVDDVINIDPLEAENEHEARLKAIKWCIRHHLRALLIQCERNPD